MYPMLPTIPAKHERDLAYTMMYGTDRREWPDATDLNTWTYEELCPGPIWTGLRAIVGGIVRFARLIAGRKPEASIQPSTPENDREAVVIPLAAQDRCRDGRSTDAA
ncbi:MAG: hypothetical protein QM589_09410 [Thermomicrobiales bacterium]